MNINEQIKKIIAQTKINDSYINNSSELLYTLTADMASHCPLILDIGKSSRENFKLFSKGQVITADINQYTDYPDIILDICNAENYPNRYFSGIICHSILEHTYDPFAAVKNLYNHLTNKGIFLGFVPFLMEYHAPSNLVFQDFFRFSKDGLAYLFKDFSDVTLYPVRGHVSSIISQLIKLKRFQTKNKKEYISSFIDCFFRKEPKQTTGYVVHAIK